MKVTHGLQNLNGEAVAHFEFELRTQQRREGEGRRGEEGGRETQRHTERQTQTETSRDTQTGKDVMNVS